MACSELDVSRSSLPTIHYTKSGKFAVVDVTDPLFCTGVAVPQQFMDMNKYSGAPLGTFFFMPRTWVDPEYGYGSTIGYLTHHPLVASPGFDTAEQALDAAEKWEAVQDKRNGKLAGWAKWRTEQQAQTNSHPKRTLVDGKMVESALPFKPEQVAKETA